MKWPFKQWINQYLNFLKKDRNGITVLSILIVMVLIINISIEYIQPKTKYDYSEFEKALAEWENSQETENQTFVSLFPFNPNTISDQDMDSLALPTFVKRNLLNYRNAGGKIKSANDFRKIYGMNDSIFQAVKEFLVFESSKEVNDLSHLTVYENNIGVFQETSDYKETNTIIIIELNSADSVELTKLNGIGPVFASRILKYRDLLGGFYKKEQLLEVYNFPEETFRLIENDLEIDSGRIKKMRLNFADFAELLRHPYLNKEQTQAIINYRDKNGAFQSANDLYEKNILDSLTFLKIEPYIECR